MAKRKRQRGSSSQKAASTQATNTEQSAASTSARAESRRAQRVVQQRQAKRRKLITYAAAAAGVAIVAVALLILFTRDTTGSASEAEVVDPPALPTDVPMEGRTMGDPNAPVTLVEYGDFQCPGCGQFARTIEPDIIENYVKTGQVKFEFRDFPFLGDESNRASEAAACALDQDKFWEMHQMIYYNQEGENRGAFDRGRLDEMAERAGLNMDQFSTCMDDNQFEEEVDQLYQAGIAAGVNSTPSFLINDEMLTGVNNYQAIANELDQALSGN